MAPKATAVDKDPSAISAGSRAYAVSKLAVLYLIYKLAEENPNIKFVVYEPGRVAGTGLARHANALLRAILVPIEFIGRMRGGMITIEVSGRELASYAFDDKLYAQVKNALYCNRGTVNKSSPESYNKSRMEQLMNKLRSIDYSKE